MTLSLRIIRLHVSQPSLCAVEIAAKLGTTSRYVRAVASRRRFKLPPSPNPQHFSESRQPDLGKVELAKKIIEGQREVALHLLRSRHDPL